MKRINEIRKERKEINRKEKQMYLWLLMVRPSMKVDGFIEFGAIL